MNDGSPGVSERAEAALAAQAASKAQTMPFIVSVRLQLCDAEGPQRKWRTVVWVTSALVAYVASSVEKFALGSNKLLYVTNRGAKKVNRYTKLEA